eukprot:g13000.t1
MRLLCSALFVRLVRGDASASHFDGVVLGRDELHHEKMARVLADTITSGLKEEYNSAKNRKQVPRGVSTSTTGAAPDANYFNLPNANANPLTQPRAQPQRESPYLLQAVAENKGQQQLELVQEPPAPGQGEQELERQHAGGIQNFQNFNFADWQRDIDDAHAAVARQLQLQQELQEFSQQMRDRGRNELVVPEAGGILNNIAPTGQGPSLLHQATAGLMTSVWRWTPFGKLRSPDYLGPPVQLNSAESLIELLEKKPFGMRDIMELVVLTNQLPWSKRWRLVRRLGSGAFGEAFLVQSLSDNGFAVMKRVPDPRAAANLEKGSDDDPAFWARKVYLKWRDFANRRVAGGGATARTAAEINEAVDGLRDECGWGASLQKFGHTFQYASRFLFMQCYESNIPEKSAQHHPQGEHELYVIVNYGGKRLDQVEFSTTQAVVGILAELSMALHYMRLAGIVHHDLKSSANIMYSENKELKVESASAAAVGGAKKSAKPKSRAPKPTRRSADDNQLGAGGGSQGVAGAGGTRAGRAPAGATTDEQVLHRRQSETGAAVGLQRRGTSKEKLEQAAPAATARASSGAGASSARASHLNDSKPTTSTPGHVVVIDFGAMLNHDDNFNTFLAAAFTPGFAPKEFDLGLRIVNRGRKQNLTPQHVKQIKNGPAFDAFSMAGVFSEVLLGENLLYRYVFTHRPRPKNRSSCLPLLVQRGAIAKQNR